MPAEQETAPHRPAVPPEAPGGAHRGAGASGDLDAPALLRAFCSPAPTPTPRRRDLALLGAAQPLPVRVDGEDVAAWTWTPAGTPWAPAVLLAHGWGSRTAHLLAFVEPLLAAGWRVVAGDAPGHGDNERRLTNLLLLSLTVEQTAGAAGGVDAVVGHSGGALATLMAIERGLDVRRLAQLAPMVRLRTSATRFASASGATTSAQQGFLAAMERTFGDDIWVRGDGLRLAAGLDTPGLVLHDPDDGEVPADEVDRLVAAWSACSYRPLQGMGHRRLLRHPDPVDAAVRFLGRPAAGAVSD